MSSKLPQEFFGFAKRAESFVVDTMMDTRREVLRLLGPLEVSSYTQGIKTLGCIAASLALAYLPALEGLTTQGRHALFILLLSAGLWVTEAIPAFAVSLVLIGLEISLLGGVGRKGAAQDWQRFLDPWASPLIWLFIGSFILGKAASRSGIDRALAGFVLGAFRGRAKATLFGVMLLTFILSMFVSNTATTVMMLTALAPLIEALPEEDPRAKAILLGAPVAANLGGMGTLIGSPPNAIAAAALATKQPIDFARWIGVGLPPALVLLGIAWLFLSIRYRASADLPKVPPPKVEVERLPRWRQILVFVTFLVTIGLWMSSSLHGIPIPVVAFLPVCVFAGTKVITADDLRSLQWDVLLLITGGLSLGIAVSETGLARFLVYQLPLSSLAPIALILGLAYLTSMLSNVMSNTVAATIIIPITVVLAEGFEAQAVVPLALAASTAMCLPISTPPNAIAHATGRLLPKDFLGVGLLMLALAPALAVFWTRLWL